MLGYTLKDVNLALILLGCVVVCLHQLGRIRRPVRWGLYRGSGFPGDSTGTLGLQLEARLEAARAATLDRVQ